MNRKALGWIGCTLAFILFLIGLYLLYGWLANTFGDSNLSEDYSFGEPDGENLDREEVEELEREPVAVPDFTIEDWDGGTFTLSDHLGGPIILNCWASWCSPCKQEMPDFQSAYEEYGQDQIRFLMVDMVGSGGETVESGKKFVEESGFTFPVYFDTEGAVAMQYGISAIPTTFFIDSGGNLVTYAQGMLTEETLEIGIGMLLEAEGQ